MKTKSVAEKLGLKKKLIQVLSLVKEIQNARDNLGGITPDNALMLHVKVWLVKTDVTDMIAVAKSHELHKKQERNNTFIDVGKDAESTKVNAREYYAKSTDEWRKLQQEAQDAEVFREYLENKRDDLGQAVFVTKTIVEYGKKDEKTTPNREI